MLTTHSMVMGDGAPRLHDSVRGRLLDRRLVLGPQARPIKPRKGVIRRGPIHVYVSEPAIERAPATYLFEHSGKGLPYLPVKFWPSLPCYRSLHRTPNGPQACGKAATTRNEGVSPGANRPAPPSVLSRIGKKDLVVG